MKVVSSLILSILFLLSLISCKRDVEDKKVLPPKQTISNVKYTVNIYLENSASMFGYIVGDTEYKTAIKELISRLQYHYSDQKVNLYLINSEIFPIKEINKLDYITNLDSKNFSKGDIYKSEINKVFTQVINKTNKNTISIVISDCIYSVSGKASGLSVQKTSIKDSFLRKSKNDFTLTTAFVKLNSKFTGIYYDSNNVKHHLKSAQRPYYFTVLGSELALSHLGNKFSFTNNEFKGLEDKLVLTSENYSNNLYYTLVNTISDKGNYKPLREASSKDAVKGMKEIRINNRNDDKFRFSVAVDLSKIPVEEKYAMTISNYKIQNDSYKVTDVKSFNINDVKPNSKLILKSKMPTHIITFESTTQNYANLNCVLLNKIPNWIYLTSTDNDSDIENNKNKTFGFKYLIEGISEANKIINPHSSEFFEIKITINKN